MSLTSQPRAIKQSTHLLTVEKAIQILHGVIDAGRPMGVTELSKRFEVNPSTVYRILTTLKAYDLVEQDASSKYKPGTGLLRLSGPIWASLEIRQVARPHLERLSTETGESVNLMILDGTRGIYVDAVESRQNIRMVVSIGATEYLHCSSVGKAIMAYLPSDRIQRILDIAGLKRLTPKTITDRPLLLGHLRIVRKRGFAFDDEEGEVGTRCVGAAILGANGTSVGGVSVSGPAFRLDLSTLASFAPLVQEAALAISHSLGYSQRRKDEKA